MFILIIGAGLPGLTCARRLAMAGHRVAVLDTQGWGLDGPDQPPVLFTGQGPLAEPRWLRRTLWRGGPTAWGAPSQRPGLRWLLKRWASRMAYGDELSSLNSLTFARRCLAELRREYAGDQQTWPTTRELAVTLYPAGQALDHLGEQRVSGREQSPPLDLARTHFPGLVAAEDQGAVADGDWGLAIPCVATARRHLLNELDGLGVQLLRPGRINRLVATSQRLRLLQTVDHLGHTEGFHADAFVFSDSSPATCHGLQHLGIQPDLAPFHRVVLQGTCPQPRKLPPVMSLHDQARATTLIRYGDRFWVLGPVLPGIGGLDDPVARDELTLVADRMLGASNWSPMLARFTSQVQMVTPSGLPTVSGSRLSNVYLNLGHGCINAQHAWAAARRLNDLLPASRPGRLGEQDSMLSLLSYPG